ncbi:tetratricopeptide repeat-containing protein [Rhodobacteraceae bacterium NNCM2]|nr:tetratricopeptide repeat-containing protein [Coraliihabitans acroporae]
MSALPIWGSEKDAEMKTARLSGWRRADLVWERLQEEAHAALEAGEQGRARRAATRAAWIARLRFRASDHRRATSLANLAFFDRLAGRHDRADRRYARAASLWQAAAPGLDHVQIAPRSRSSLFHMRMEIRHADTFRANLTKRLKGFAGETERALHALAAREPVEGRFHGRWRGEKPPVFDDTRRFLAAALLLMTPGNSA